MDLTHFEIVNLTQRIVEGVLSEEELLEVAKYLQEYTSEKDGTWQYALEFFPSDIIELRKRHVPLRKEKNIMTAAGTFAERFVRDKTREEIIESIVVFRFHGHRFEQVAP